MSSAIRGLNILAGVAALTLGLVIYRSNPLMILGCVLVGILNFYAAWDGTS